MELKSVSIDCLFVCVSVDYINENHTHTHTQINTRISHIENQSLNTKWNFFLFLCVHLFNIYESISFVNIYTHRQTQFYNFSHRSPHTFTHTHRIWFKWYEFDTIIKLIINSLNLIFSFSSLLKISIWYCDIKVGKKNFHSIIGLIFCLFI